MCAVAVIHFVFDIRIYTFKKFNARSYSVNSRFFKTQIIKSIILSKYEQCFSNSTKYFYRNNEWTSQLHQTAMRCTQGF